jgi:AraC family transcriptional regulator of adaptative response/methylated-DNA-[protein]-cysteine methyltransferase
MKSRIRSIGFHEAPCSLGHALVAATDRGVCFVRFGRSPEELRKQLASSFPAANLEGRATGPVADWTRAIVDYVDGKSDRAEVPLDVIGTRFAERVWRALRQIPMGETRTYSEIARRIGDPAAARAVARAVTQNPAPVLIPCHRVILKSGKLAGDAAGVSYQRAMLVREGAM